MPVHAQSFFGSFFPFLPLNSSVQTFFWSKKQAPFLRKVAKVNNILILYQLFFLSFAYVCEPVQFYECLSCRKNMFTQSHLVKSKFVIGNAFLCNWRLQNWWTEEGYSVLYAEKSKYCTRCLHVFLLFPSPDSFYLLVGLRLWWSFLIISCLLFLDSTSKITKFWASWPESAAMVGFSILEL